MTWKLILIVSLPPKNKKKQKKKKQKNLIQHINNNRHFTSPNTSKIGNIGEILAQIFNEQN